MPSPADPDGLAGSTHPHELADLDHEAETVILDRQWAREAPVHELSARGRAVQRRLQARAGTAAQARAGTAAQARAGTAATAATAARPSRWKRFRFWLFRRIRGR